jgi:chromosome segregation ATPase
MAVKAEVASTRLRYETQINTLQNELTSIHRQCERFKKDRDSYKQLLEAAQKNIGELKQNRKSYTSASSGDEDDKSKIHGLEQQIGCLEDELSESRLEASKLRTEMISEKSAFEIKISEMQSKMNSYEEDRLLSNSKVPGTKSRLEMTWQKEREDQQRLLSETSTLARDLRQTLFEVERERDKERLESRRKIDQIKKATEEELEEGRRKISELQSDLLELRDAHAKLRTANEKLRRDRDRYERERDANSSSSKRRLEQVGEKKVGALLQTVDELVKIAPELQNFTKESSSHQHHQQSSLSIPNPPLRSKSRSPSPTPSLSSSTMQISTVLARLAEASDELRRYQRLCDDERDRERARRGGMRRAASQENDNGLESNTNRPIARLNRSSQGSLYRKSLSLDQSMQGEQQQQIWKDSDVGSMSSVQSIDSEYGIRRGDSSMDSRISTQSDVTGRRKKKKGIMGKLRSLTKSSRGAESDASVRETFYTFLKILL